MSVTAQRLRDISWELYRAGWNASSKDVLAAAEQAEQLGKLLDWRVKVTVALRREGGAFYDDVPLHIYEMREQLAVSLAETETLRHQWRTARITIESQAEQIATLTAERDEARQQGYANTGVIVGLRNALELSERERDKAREKLTAIAAIGMPVRFASQINVILETHQTRRRSDARRDRPQKAKEQ